MRVIMRRMAENYANLKDSMAEMGATPDPGIQRTRMEAVFSNSAKNVARRSLHTHALVGATVRVGLGPGHRSGSAAACAVRLTLPAFRAGSKRCRHHEKQQRILPDSGDS